MKNILFAATLLTALALSPGSLQAQILWTDAAGDSSWSNTGNWNSAAVPTSASAVQIASMQPGDNIVGIDTGTNVTVSSFTFNNTLNTITNPPVQVLSFGEQLTVNGAIANNSNIQDQFGLTVNAGANANYAGGSAGLLFDFLNVNTRTITTSGSLLVPSGGTLVFDINSLTSYGSIGAIAASGATINVAGTYTGHAGDVFNLTSGNFNGAVLGQLPTLAPGLTWDKSQFNSAGILAVDATAVPEPSSFALFGLGMIGLFLLARRQRPAGKLS